MHPYPYQTKRKRILHKTNDVSTRESPVFIQLLLGQFSNYKPRYIPTFGHCHMVSPPLLEYTIYSSLSIHPSLPLFSAYFTRHSYVLHMFYRYQERATRLFVRISTFLPYSTGRRTTNGTSHDYISSPRIRTIVRHAFAFANITHLKTRFFPIYVLISHIRILTLWGIIFLRCYKSYCDYLREKITFE